MIWRAIDPRSPCRVCAERRRVLRHLALGLSAPRKCAGWCARRYQNRGCDAELLLVPAEEDPAERLIAEPGARVPG